MDIAHLQRHERIALQVSGGRDSLAMFAFMRGLGVLDRMTVYYLNSGDAYPETVATMHKVSGISPRYVEVAGNVHAVRRELGWPVDVLDAGAQWPFGEDIQDHMRLVDRYTCCALSMMKPMHERMVADGITLILRGQRASDNPRSHVRDGEVVDGIEIRYPIESWSDDEVCSMIEAGGFDVPPFYAHGMTSAPDCMACTAWLEHGNGFRKAHYPEMHASAQRKLIAIRKHIEPAYQRLVAATEEV